MENHSYSSLCVENDLSSCFYRLAVMDLIVAMAPFVDEASMTQTYELIKPFLEVGILPFPS